MASEAKNGPPFIECMLVDGVPPDNTRCLVLGESVERAYIRVKENPAELCKVIRTHAFFWWDGNNGWRATALIDFGELGASSRSLGVRTCPQKAVVKNI